MSAATTADDPPTAEEEIAYENDELIGRHAAAHAAKWSLIEKWATRLVMFATFALLGRLVAPNVFGLLAIATVITSLLQLFMDTGITEGIIRRKVIDEGVLHTAFWLSLGAGMLLLILGETLSAPMAALYHEPQLKAVLRVMCIGVLLQSFGAVQDALLQRKMMFKQLAARRLLAALAGGAVGIVWAIVNPGVWALVAQYLTLTATGTIVLWKVGSYRPRFRFVRSQARSLLSFGSNVLGIRFLTFLTDQGDNFIVGLILGPAALGFYVIGFRIYATVNDVVTVALTQVALPVFSRLQHRKDELVKALLAATRASVAVGVPFMLGAGALAYRIVPEVFGSKWGPSVPVMEVLSLVGLLIQ